MFYILDGSSFRDFILLLNITSLQPQGLLREAAREVTFEVLFLAGVFLAAVFFCATGDDGDEEGIGKTPCATLLHTVVKRVSMP